MVISHSYVSLPEGNIDGPCYMGGPCFGGLKIHLAHGTASSPMDQRIGAGCLNTTSIN